MRCQALFGAVLSVSLSASCVASDWLTGRVVIEGFAGRSVITLLGSEDPRSTRGLGVGLALPGIRRLRVGSLVPETVVLAYYQRSTSPGASEQPPNGTDAYGVLLLNRYSKPLGNGFSAYFDAGIGFQYADQRTVDLSGRGSFTPAMGLGFMYRRGGVEWSMGARLLHISNAGLQGNNQGQNQLLITASVRF